MKRCVAFDLGATSGRVIVAEIGADELRLEEVHRFPNGGCATTTGRCAGTSNASTTRCWSDYGRLPRPGRSTASASTRGPSTTGCSMVMADCWVRRTPTETRALTGSGRRWSPRSVKSCAVRRHRDPAAAVQHALPARRGARHDRLPAGRHAAAPAGPARLLAHREPGRRTHQRLDHAVPRRHHPRVVAAAAREARPANRPAARAGRGGGSDRDAPSRRGR